MKIKDCKERDLDDIYLYYGREKLSNIDKDALHNHLYKTRVNHKLPKLGTYCMPEELFEFIGEEHSNKINKMFRNVQYIIINDKLYWIYCLDINGLYDFSFIGDNMSIYMARSILTSNGYELGFKRKNNSDGTPLSKIVEVWFNPLTLMVVVLKTPVNNFVITNRSLYYRKFEGDEVECNNKYTSLNQDIIIRVPFTDSYCEDDKYINWSSLIDMSVEEDPSDFVLTIKDYTANTLYFNVCDYHKMLVSIFNCKSNNLPQYQQYYNGPLAQPG